MGDEWVEFPRPARRRCPPANPRSSAGSGSRSSCAVPSSRTDRDRAFVTDPHAAAPPAAGEGAGAHDSLHAHVRPRRLVARARRDPRVHGAPDDARVPADAVGGVRIDPDHRERGAVRAARARRPLLEREPARGGAAAARGARVPDRRLPRRRASSTGSSGVALRRRRPRQRLHGLPAAVGPALVLGGHDLDGHARLRARGSARRSSGSRAAAPTSAPTRSSSSTRSTRRSCRRCSSC